MPKPKSHEIISYGYVYKITFPNGKIYIGADYGRNASLDVISYFGSYQNKRAVLDDHLELLEATKTFTVKKELIFEAKDCTPASIRLKETELIRSHHATDPSIGYNLKH
jgi:hypothetical protein